jgi:hypothetical protein
MLKLAYELVTLHPDKAVELTIVNGLLYQKRKLCVLYGIPQAERNHSLRVSR